MKQLQNKRGTTLVELIVCMVLLSILTLAAVTLIRPSAQAYRDIQQQTRAQNLADALIETIRGEVLDANGYIRFTNGATDSANLDSVFDAQTSYSDGTALEFSVYPNHVELIDKDLVPALKNSKGKDLLTQAQADELKDYLHMRFYQAFRYNPLLVLILPWLILYYLICWIQWLICGREKLSVNIPLWIPMTVLIMMLIYGIVRNIGVYPFTVLAPTKVL